VTDVPTTHLIDIIRKVSTMRMDEMLKVQSIHDELMDEMNRLRAELTKMREALNAIVDDASGHELPEYCSVDSDLIENARRVLTLTAGKRE